MKALLTCSLKTSALDKKRKNSSNVLRNMKKYLLAYMGRPALKESTCVHCLSQDRIGMTVSETK